MLSGLAGIVPTPAPKGKSDKGDKDPDSTQRVSSGNASH